MRRPRCCGEPSQRTASATVSEPMPPIGLLRSHNHHTRPSTHPLSSSHRPRRARAADRRRAGRAAPLLRAAAGAEADHRCEQVLPVSRQQQGAAASKFAGVRAHSPAASCTPARSGFTPFAEETLDPARSRRGDTHEGAAGGLAGSRAGATPGRRSHLAGPAHSCLIPRLLPPVRACEQGCTLGGTWARTARRPSCRCTAPTSGPRRCGLGPAEPWAGGRPCAVAMWPSRLFSLLSLQDLVPGYRAATEAYMQAVTALGHRLLRLLGLSLGLGPAGFAPFFTRPMVHPRRAACCRCCCCGAGLLMPCNLISDVLASAAAAGACRHRPLLPAPCRSSCARCTTAASCRARRAGCLGRGRTPITVRAGRQLSLPPLLPPPLPLLPLLPRCLPLMAACPHDPGTLPAPRLPSHSPPRRHADVARHRQRAGPADLHRRAHLARRAAHPGRAPRQHRRHAAPVRAWVGGCMDGRRGSATLQARPGAACLPGLGGRLPPAIPPAPPAPRRSWTNGRYRSTLHRVVNAHGRERHSIAFFFEPDFEARVEALPQVGGRRMGWWMEVQLHPA